MKTGVPGDDLKMSTLPRLLCLHAVGAGTMGSMHSCAHCTADTSEGAVRRINRIQGKSTHLAAHSPRRGYVPVGRVDVLRRRFGVDGATAPCLVLLGARLVRSGALPAERRVFAGSTDLHMGVGNRLRRHYRSHRRGVVLSGISPAANVGTQGVGPAGRIDPVCALPLLVTLVLRSADRCAAAHDVCGLVEAGYPHCDPRSLPPQPGRRHSYVDTDGLWINPIELFSSEDETVLSVSPPPDTICRDTILIA
jgi:hypothetical protein